MNAHALRTTVTWLVVLVVGCGGTAVEPVPIGGPPAVEPSKHPRFSGLVQEVLRGGPYSYLRIADDSDDRRSERWVVTMSPPPPTARRVEVESFGVRHDFYARRIDRRFAVLEFGIVQPESP